MSKSIVSALLTNGLVILQIVPAAAIDPPEITGVENINADVTDAQRTAPNAISASTVDTSLEPPAVIAAERVTADVSDVLATVPNVVAAVEDE